MPTRRKSRRHSLPCVRAIFLVLTTAACGFAASPPASGVKVPPGFVATLYADDHLAHDIFSMTVDAKGRIVVAGPGYVRILIDKDGDGKADSFIQFADGPKSGAQGLYFHGNDLICTGDGGLLRYRDRDGDGRANGKPDVFLKYPYRRRTPFPRDSQRSRRVVVSHRRQLSPSVTGKLRHARQPRPSRNPRPARSCG